MIFHRTLAAIIIGTTFAAIPCSAQTSQKLTAGKANEYGLIYSLPLTGVDICIEAELTREEPGEFFNSISEYPMQSPKKAGVPTCAASHSFLAG